MRNLMKSAMTLAAAGGLGMSGLLAPGQAATGEPLPAAAAGKLVAWGDNSAGAATVPASLDGVDVVDVDASTVGWGAAVTTEGAVVGWGDGRPATSGLSNVAAIDAYGTGLAALKKDGGVAGAGDPSTGLDAAPALTGATDVAVNMMAGAAVEDGTVHVWGSAVEGTPDLNAPEDLDDATQVAGGLADFSAVRSDGTVVNWGAFFPTPVPASVQGHVKSIAGGQVSGLVGSIYAAVLDDGSVQAWDSNGEIATPAELEGESVIDVDVNGSIVALTEDGQVVAWGTSQTPPDLPASFDGVPLAVSAGMNPDNSSFAHAIVSPFKAMSNPLITGTPQVGQTLRLTPAEFTASPDQVDTQWLADGVDIADASGESLSLTTAQVGSRISVRQTASRTGQADAITVSAATSPVTARATTPPPAPPTKVASKTDVHKVKVNKRGQKVVVKVRVTAAGAVRPTGKVKVVLKRGQKKVAAANVKVNASGVAKLNSRDLKRKQAKQLRKPGRYKVIARYKGSALVMASKDTDRFTVRR